MTQFERERECFHRHGACSLHHNQALYYKALQDSHTGPVDCRPFIDFMLDAIGNSLYKFIDIATETAEQAPQDVGVNVGVSVGVSDRILELLARQPRLSAKELAGALKKTTRTVERHLKALRDQGRLRRVGSDKAGHWEVIEKPDCASASQRLSDLRPRVMKSDAV